ncbi:hypothetical protein G4441_04720 [Blautia wexlerae]|jgi:hypothetical protein|uniref:hypothetical protein n=1 Tax=Blautia wexlerae TaxID=418240 RepID=UPI0015715855|nr:hypothetical protein [Blautia wexlerae]NSC39657.1 hypothetical protein [Blautia wexlerae]NSC43093.1 hypothetical protein [Blautia wexlerae]NSF86765.1 hypothetical protein [Blautia wexlerae]
MGLMDIVEFVEKVCEFSLTDFQKEFVRKVYDAAKNDKRLYYVPPRCNQKFSFELLQAIVIIIVGKERGLVKGEEMIRKAASKTTPLVEKEGKTVTDYEYLFSMNLQAKLKEKIQGAIYVKVNENDSLVIKVTRRDGNNFDMSFTDFANRMLNGLTTDYTAYEVVQKYKKFVMTQFFK